MRLSRRRWVGGVAAALLLTTTLLPAPLSASDCIDDLNRQVAGDTDATDPGAFLPLITVHGWKGSPSSLDGLVERLESGYRLPVSIQEFDYTHINDHWVTDPGIGDRLWSWIECLSDVSAANGGPGQVVLAAHSMGGLAIRDALQGDSARGERVAFVGTFGTPHLGASLSGTGFIEDAVSEVSDLPFIEDALVELLAFLFINDEATDGLEKGSDHLSVLHSYPPNVPVWSSAGEIVYEKNYLLFTTTSFYGDVIVDAESASAFGQPVDPIGGSTVWECNALSEELLFNDAWLLIQTEALAPCVHMGIPLLSSSLMRNQGLLDDFIGRLAILIRNLTEDELFAPISSSTVLVMDISGSMDDPSPVGPLRKIDGAIEAATGLTSVISIDDAGQTAGLVSFSSGARVAQPPTINLSSVDSAVRRLTPNGRTNIGAGLQVGLDTVGSAEDIRLLILLSDGDTNEGLSQSRILDEVTARAVREDVVIDVVAFAPPGSLDEQFLRELATRTGGSFDVATSALELQTAFIRSRHDSTGIIVAEQSGVLRPESGSFLSEITIGEGTGQLLASIVTGSADLELVFVDPLGRTFVAGDTGVLSVQGNPATTAVSSPISGEWEIHVLAAGQSFTDGDPVLPDWTPPLGGIATAAERLGAQVVVTDVPFGFVASVREGGPNTGGGLPRPLAASETEAARVLSMLAGLATVLVTAAFWPYQRCGHCLTTAGAGARVCDRCGSPRTLGLTWTVAVVLAVGAAVAAWIWVAP